MEIKRIAKGDIFEKIPSKIMNEMADAVLTVLKEWKMSGMDLTKEFERKFAEWHGMKYGLGYNNGTASILGAMYGIGICPGDEIICPSITFYASCLQAYSLGATVVFADIEPDTLCINPNDIENKITDKTKAIIVVHYSGMPAKMDEIMKIANKYHLKVIEDVSHAHGALYKGKMVGTFGDVSGFSLMSTKSFSIGEAGILLTNDREVYERAIIFGHYLRHNEVHIEYLKKGIGLAWGGYKHRMHQMSAAMGLVLLKYYPEMMQEIDKAMNYFWDLLEDCPGIRAHRPDKNSGSTKGGWYFPLGLYKPEELGGLSVTGFCEALQAKGIPSTAGCNRGLHLHPVFNEIDIYNEGKPTIISRAKRDVRKLRGNLPVSEGIQEKVFTIPLFYKYEKPVIEEYAYAFKEVINNYKGLLPGDKGNPKELGGWSASFRR